MILPKTAAKGRSKTRRIEPDISAMHDASCLFIVHPHNAYAMCTCILCHAYAYALLCIMNLHNVLSVCICERHMHYKYPQSQQHNVSLHALVPKPAKRASKIIVFQNFVYDSTHFYFSSLQQLQTGMH